MSKASSFWSQHSQPFGLWLPARSSSGNACTVQQSCGKHVPTLNTVGVKWLDAAKPMSKPGHQNHMASGISWHLHLLPKTRTFIFPCAPITSRFYIPEKPMNTSDWRLLHPRYPQNLISTSPLHPHSSNDGHASQKANDTRHQKPPAADSGRSLQVAVWKSWVQYNTMGFWPTQVMI